MTPRVKWIAAGAVLAVGIGGFLIFRPDKLFVDDVANETLSTDVQAALDAAREPTTLPSSSSSGSSSEPTESTGAASTTTIALSSSAATTSRGPVSSASTAPTTASQSTSPSTAPATATPTTRQTTPPTTQPTTQATTQPPAAQGGGATVLLRGQWVGLEHDTSGSVAVVQTAAGRQLVFEDLRTSNGPDLRVYLSPKAAQPDSWGGYNTGGVQLGRLKGNVGTQTYEIPASVDLDSLRTAVIWCERFSVGFGAADLR